LVLLYAQSGAGKTSLLNAGVIPWLVRNEAFDVLPVVRVGGAIPKDIDPTDIKNVYVFNTLVGWSDRGEEIDALKSVSIHSFLEERVRPTDEQGFPVPRLVVFDQLEELFTSFPTRWREREEFCRQVAEASESDPQLRVLFALREDYLASLYTFAPILPGELRTTFRLERLRQEDACAAIELPAKATGYSFADGVPNILCRELMKVKVETASGEMVEVAGEYVEPIMLQVVCRNLWSNLPPGVTVISSSHVQTFGNVEEALGNFFITAVREVTRNTTVREDDLRLWFSRRLITSIGTRGMVLQEQTRTGGIPNAVVRKLEDEHHIVRTELRAGSRWCELTHDRLIGPIQKANEELEQRLYIHRVGKRILQWAVPFAIIVLITLVVYGEIHKINLAATNAAIEAQNAKLQLSAVRDWQEGGLLEELQREPDEEKRKLLAGVRFDSLALYFLYELHGPERLDRLRDLLVRYQELIPPEYGVRTPGQTEPGALTGSSPLTIEYSRARSIDERLFAMEWLTYAQSVATNWGIPVPSTVQLIPVQGLPKERIRIKAPGVEPQVFDLNGDERNALLVLPEQSGANDTALEFFHRFQKDWQPFQARKGMDVWWVVPQWSRPVWNVGLKKEYLPTSGSGFDAFRTIQHLLKNPEPLLSSSAIDFLMQRKRMQDLYGQTVEEAKRARGDRLALDLAAFVRNGTPLLSLPQILDGLAEAPKEESAVIAGRFNETTWLDQTARIPKRLHGPWKAIAQRENNAETLTETRQFYSAIESRLPYVEYPIRVYVGRKLAEAWFVGDALSPQLSAALQKLRDDFHRDYGISLPGVRFHSSQSGDDIPPNGVRLEMLNERPGLGGVKPELLSHDHSISDFVAILRRGAEDLRVFWITAESTQQLIGSENSQTSAGRDEVAAATGKWLRNKYSLTDLKVLLRAVVVPTTGGTEESARYTKWLLTSLVFWSKFADDPLDTSKMQSLLRDTQRARLRVRKGDITPQIAGAVKRGVDALVDDRPNEAETAFTTAVTQDREAAARAFLAIWPTRLPRIWLGQSDLSSLPNLSHIELLDLQDMPEVLDPQYVNLCRLASGIVDGKAEQAAIERELLTSSSADEWPVERAWWLGQRYLSHYDPLKDDPRYFSSAAALLKTAIVRFDDNQAYDAFSKILTISQKRQINSVWSLVKELATLRAESRPESLKQSRPLELAFVLSDEERQERLTDSLSMAGYVDRLLQAPSVGEEDRDYYSEWVRYIRAFSYHGLARLGDESHWQEAEALLKSLLESKTEPIARGSQIRLIQLLYERGQYYEADNLCKVARHRWPDDLTLQATEMFGYLREGRVEAVAAVAREAGARVEREHDEDLQAAALYLAAIGGMLTHSSDWESVTRRFLQTNHDYRDYVLLMLYAYAGGRTSPSARRLLETRWGEISTTTLSWPERLSIGDASVWREMLVGRVAGRISENELFSALEDEEAWRRSALFQLPVPRRGLLCEAWFYEAMLAKAEGRTDRMRECLRHCISIGYTAYYEHAMALFLLRQQD
jgi:N-glycosylase/DNA lyase